jgi:cysteine-rich repeat protein
LARALRPSIFAACFVAPLFSACSSPSTEDLFGGAGGTGATGTSTGSMSTGSMSTGSTSTGSTSTGSTSTSTTSTTTTSTGTSSTSTASTGVTTSSSTTGGGPFCGDGVQNQPSEECDGADLAGHDCTDMGFVSPDGLACTGACKLDYGGCSATCGNGTVEPGEQCDDGNANAFDACSNQCHAQGTCGQPIPVALANGSTTIGADTDGTSNFLSSGCQSADGPELVYAVTVASTGFLTAWTDPTTTDYDAVVYARVGNSCMQAPEVACGDNTSQQPDLLSIPVLGGQTVYLFVDGYQMASGHFDLHLDVSVGTCADPVPILVGDNGFVEDAHGITTGQGNDGLGSCGGGGPDVVYAVTRLSAGQVKVQTTPAGAAFNTVTYARSTCDNGLSELSCNNDLMSQSSAISIGNVDPATPTYVWIDGTAGQQGTYDVSFGP